MAPGERQDAHGRRGGRRSERVLRRRCRHLLHRLDVRVPLDVDDLCRRVGAERGRPVRLVAHPIPVPGPFGCWISTTSADWVVYQQETTRAHQEHIVLHELGHIVAGHTGVELPADERAPASSVVTALWRGAYDDEAEWEAETVATIIRGWASLADGVAARGSAPVVEDPLLSALSDRRGWW